LRSMYVEDILSHRPTPALGLSGTNTSASDYRVLRQGLSKPKEERFHTQKRNWQKVWISIKKGQWTSESGAEGELENQRTVTPKVRT